MAPQIMVGIQGGPNEDYAEEYCRVNNLITEVSSSLAVEIGHKGLRAKALAASERTDKEKIKEISLIKLPLSEQVWDG